MRQTLGGGGGWLAWPRMLLHMAAAVDMRALKFCIRPLQYVG